MKTIKLTENTKCMKYLKEKNRTEILTHLITNKQNYKKRDRQVTEKKKLKTIQVSELIFLQRKKPKKTYGGN